MMLEENCESEQSLEGVSQFSPTALRKQTPQKRRRTSDVTLSLGYTPPYRWEELLRFLAFRAIPGIELVANGEYRRTVRLTTTEGTQVLGWIRVGHRPQKHVLVVTISESLLPVLPQVLARLRHLFDLSCDPQAVFDALGSMNELRSDLCVLGTRLPGCFDTFEMAVRAVLGQQITVKAASTLAARIVAAFGTPLQTGIEGLTHVFPSSEEILALGEPIENRLGPLGVTAARSKTIYALAKALIQGDISLNPCVQPEKEIKRLVAIRGIGNWTAHYLAMRAMGWSDAFLETDVGVKKALGQLGRSEVLEPLEPFESHKALGQLGSKEILEMAESWRPWRSYATIGLWNSLSV